MRSKSVEVPVTSEVGAGGTPPKICSKIAPADPPLNGGRPVAISYKTMPTEKYFVSCALPAMVSAPAPPLGSASFATEVQHLHLPPRRDEEIGRLQVAVHDAFAVRGVERIGDVLAERQHIVERQRAAGDAGLQRFALEQLHDHVVFDLLGARRLVLADVVERADVRVIE
jgi:hypothetical protein